MGDDKRWTDEERAEIEAASLADAMTKASGLFILPIRLDGPDFESRYPVPLQSRIVGHVIACWTTMNPVPLPLKDGRVLHAWHAYFSTGRIEPDTVKIILIVLEGEHKPKLLALGCSGGIDVDGQRMPCLELSAALLPSQMAEQVAMMVQLFDVLDAIGMDDAPAKPKSPPAALASEIDDSTLHMMFAALRGNDKLNLGGWAMSEFAISNERSHREHLEAALLAFRRLLEEQGIAVVHCYFNPFSYIEIGYQRGKPFLITCLSKPVRVADFAERNPKELAEFVAMLARGRAMRFYVTVAAGFVINDARYTDLQERELPPIKGALLDYETYCTGMGYSPFGRKVGRDYYLLGWHDGAEGRSMRPATVDDIDYQAGYLEGDRFRASALVGIREVVHGPAPHKPEFGNLFDIMRARTPSARGGK